MAWKPYEPQPFSYTPNEADPELELLRRRALRQGEQDHMKTSDELARYGLGGSGAAFGVLGQAQNRTNAALEDADNMVYARRRAEALDQYNRQQDYMRQISLLDKQQAMQDRQGLMNTLGSIGGLAGRAALGYFTGGASELLGGFNGTVTPGVPTPFQYGGYYR